MGLFFKNIKMITWSDPDFGFADLTTAHTKKGAAQTEPPPNGCYFQNAVVTFSVVANLKG